MFYWIFATLLDSLSTIFWKKSLDLSILSNPAFALVWNTVWLIIFIIFLCFWYFEISSLLDFKIIALMFLTMWLSAFSWIIMQKVYSRVKISEMAPYSNLDKLFIIVFSFFLFSNASIYSLLIAIFTVLLISIFSIDFKNFRLPKSFELILISKLVKSATILLLWYVLTKYSSATIASLDAITSCIIYIFMMKIVDWKQVLKSSKAFYYNRYTGSVLWWVSYFITLFLISDLWMILTTLLWFLWLWATLLMSYFILKDKPDKKSIILAVIVSRLVAFGYYLK